MAAFSTIFADVTKLGTKLQTSEYLENGKYPIIDQGQATIAGYTNQENGLFTDVPVIIFGDHTLVVKYIDTPFFLGADGVKVLKGIRADTDARYLYYAASAVRIPNTGYNRHFKWLKEADIPLPDLPTQRRIAATLDKVSEGIALCKQMLADLDDLVKARFVEMFGLPGLDRFGWGLVSLGSACHINPKKSQDTRLNVGIKVSFVPMQAVTENGLMDTSTVKDYGEVKTGFTYFAENDVLFAKITPCMENGKGAIAKKLCNGIGFGSTEFHVLRPISGVSNPYWIYVLSSFSQFRKDAENNMTGSAGQRRVPASFLKNYRVAVPPMELQNQFATFVSQVDKSKFVVQQQLADLETIKKSLIQEYFV